MSAILRDDDVDAETEHGIFLECAARLKIAEEAESENRIKGLEAITFRDGQQWDEAVSQARVTSGRPALTINHTNTVCLRTENQLKQQRPRIKCHPVGGGARKETAEVVNGLIRHIENLSNASIAYDQGGVSSIDIGWGYWTIDSAYCYDLGDKNAGFNDQELLIRPIMNTFTVYMDPASIMPAGEDQDWCIISEVMKRNEYRLKYPTADNADWRGGEAPGDMALGWDSKDQIRLALYYRKHRVKDTLVLMNDGRAVLKSTLPDKSTMLAANWLPVTSKDGKPMERACERIQIQCFRLNGTKIIEKRDLPGNHIPVIRCQGNRRDVNGRVIRKGMVADLMDPARMYNYWRSAETERYALAPKAPWVAYENVIEGHPEWHDANQKPYSVLVAKAAHDDQGNLLPLPVRQDPVPIEAGMMQAAQGAEHDLMAVAGMPQENGQDQSRVVSGNKYLARRQGERDLTHFQFYDNQTYAIMWTGIILLELIPYYYDTKRMQRIIGVDGTPEMVEINPGQPQEGGQDMAIYNVAHNLQVGRYDIVMDTGPGYQTKREEGTEAVLGLLSTPLGEKVATLGGDLVIRNMDFSGSDELADRLAVSTPEGMKKAMEGLPSQAKSIVTAMQQQIDQQKQVIQQQALEIKYKSEIEQAKLKSHGMIEAAKLETAEDKSKREDATKRFDIEVTRQTDLDVAEINAAKQLLNTKAEQEHEEKQTDKLIEKGLETGMRPPKE